MTRLLSILLLLAVFSCGDDPTDPEKPAQPSISVVIDYPDEFFPYLDDSTYVQVLIDSDAELDSVVATVGPLRATLAEVLLDGHRFRLGAIHGGGALDLGRHELAVTAFGSEGGVGADTFTVLREPKPVIEVASPRGPYEVLGHRPRIAATCTDPVRGDCASLDLRAHTVESWPVLARSDGAIDTVMDWNAVFQDDGYVTFRLVGSTVGGREAEAWFSALVAPTDGLVGVDSVVGVIADADSGRILSRQWCGNAFLLPWECDGPRLRIKNRSTGAVVVSPVLPTSDRAGTSRAVLTSTGAMTGKPTGIDFHDSRIETLGSADAIRVSGPYAVFTDAGRILLRDHRSAPGQPAWSRELSTGADRYAFRVDVGSNGTVVFTADVGRPVVRWQDGGLDTLAVSGHAVALGDAFIAYTRPRGDVWEDDYEVVVLAAGVEEVVGLLPERYHQLEAAGEWLLFVANPTAQRNDDGDWTSVPGQSWIRYPDGRVVELPATASHVVDLADDGRVLFKYAWETDPYGLYLFDPTTGRTTPVARYYEAAGFTDSDIWVSLGRHLFRPR